MHHAASGDIEMVSREDVSRPDINDHGRATTARHGARNRRLQRRNAWLSRCRRQCRRDTRAITAKHRQARFGRSMPRL